MSLPEPPTQPPFTITRFSHVRLNVRDLDVSRVFYEELVGLVCTSQDADHTYLRGVEEAAHHSLVLHAPGGEPSAECIGFRVASEADLDAAHDHFSERGLTAEWVTRAHQSRTLRVNDVGGVPLELCVSMDVVPRLVIDDDAHRGAAAARIDHLQVQVARIAEWVAFHVGLGFRISEYATPSGGPDTPLVAAFLSRKGDLLDLVGVMGPGPRLHHFAYVVHNHASTLIRACDIASGRGWRDAIEYGPGRHGLAPQHFLYLRDPDGHRVELVSHGYQLLDPEVEAIGWSIEDPRAATTWGPPPGQSWMEEASLFEGVTPAPPDLGALASLTE